MMTKKNFEAVAATFATRANELTSARADFCSPAEAESIDSRLEELEHMAEFLAGTFGFDNPNFDRERFLLACGF